MSDLDDGDLARAVHGTASPESAIRIIRAAMAPFGIAQMLVDGQRAVELEPPGSRWHPFASVVLGSAELVDDNRDRAVKHLQRAAYLGRDAQKPAAGLAHAQLALLAAERQDWIEAADHAGQAQDLVRDGRLQEQSWSVLSHAASARVAVHRGDRDAALEHVAAVARSSGGPRPPVVFPWLKVQAGIALARVLLDLGDVAAARLKIREARTALAQLITHGTLVDHLQRLAREVDDHHGSDQDGEDGPRALPTLTRAELRVLQLLPMHLTLTDIGGELGLSRNTVKTHVAAIYRKLQATTRADAVQRAKHRGLLGS